MTNFSTSVGQQRRVKVLHEVRPLLEAPAKCREIWHGLLLADYKKEGSLNAAALQVFMDRQRDNLRDLLLVRSVDEMLELLDEDEDGFLNEDEQILLFSAIKERMQRLAEELCSIHEYSLYKDMMTAIRTLEKDIIHYQGLLRDRTHKKELQIYAEIGQDKAKDFKEHWKAVFEEFEEECRQKVEELRQVHAEELEALNERLSATTEYIRIKPKACLKELQVQEKLLAVNERYYEAQQIRNELKVLEDAEHARIEKDILAKQEAKRKLLLIEQDKAIRQLEVKNKTLYNKLRIQMQHQRARLEKEVKLHYHDITKNQNLARRLGEKLGSTRDELRRVKGKSKRMQEFLKESKAISSRTLGSSVPQTAPTQRSGVMSSVSTTFGFKPGNPLKSSIREATKFSIKSDVASDRPVNVVPDYLASSSFAAKTSKILSQSRKETTSLPSLTSLYNQNLQVIN